MWMEGVRGREGAEEEGTGSTEASGLRTIWKVGEEDIKTVRHLIEVRIKQGERWDEKSMRVGPNPRCCSPVCFPTDESGWLTLSGRDRKERPLSKRAFSTDSLLLNSM